MAMDQLAFHERVVVDESDQSHPAIAAAEDVAHGGHAHPLGAYNQNALGRQREQRERPPLDLKRHPREHQQVEQQHDVENGYRS